MKYLLIFIINNLLLLHQGSLLIKIWSAIKLAVLALIPTWLISTISGWSITNSEYIAGVLTCIAIDHIIGSVYHAFKVKDFTIKKNLIGLITKLSLCVVAGILFEIIKNTVSEHSLIYEYLQSLTRLIIILYPAGSAFMNMSAITNGRFPPIGWINKIKTFNKDLDIQRFSKGEETDYNE